VTSGTKLDGSAERDYSDEYFYVRHDKLSVSASARLDPADSSHSCRELCDRGGDHDACASPGESADTQRLCVDLTSAQDLCNADADCNWVAQEDDFAHYLVGSFTVSGGTFSETSSVYQKTNGRACTHFSDYTHHAGTLTVTQRVLTGIDYVFSSGDEVSIEVIADPADTAGLTFVASSEHGTAAGGLDTGLSHDRVMVIECGGSCGASRASAQVTADHDWSDLVASNVFHDLDGIKGEAKGTTTTQRNYAFHTDTLGAGTPLGPDSHVVMTELGNFQKNASAFLCNERCRSDGADAAVCSETAYYQDTATSAAFCMTLSEAQQLIDNLARIHTGTELCMAQKGTTSRFYLYEGSAACSGEAATGYKLYVASEDDAETRRLSWFGAEVNAWSWSWKELLRFKQLQFSTGGTYKVCFCDHAHTPSNSCRSHTDFRIEIGTAHVSGVACLLTNPKLRNRYCSEQEYNGLMCYDQQTYDAVPAPAHVWTPGTVEQAVVQSAAAEALSTFCLRGPAETGRLPECQVVEEYDQI